MTDTTSANAKDFASGILHMSFSDVMQIVDAINQANGGRKTIDGKTLLSAANLILDGKVVEPGDIPAKPRVPSPGKAAGAK